MSMDRDPHANAQATIDRTRLILGASPLTADADTMHEIARADLEPLVRLAEEALDMRRRARPLLIGPRGRIAMVENGIKPRLEIFMEDSAALGRAAALITQDITIEPAPPRAPAANDQGEGSPSNEDEDFS